VLGTYARVRAGREMEARADRVMDLRTMGERDMARWGEWVGNLTGD
jgi:hypothetical protein